MTTSTPKPSSGKGSVGGFMLALFSLILAAIGSGLVHAHYKTTHPLASKISEQVAAGTGHAISSIVSLPFLVGGMLLAIIAALLLILRLSKGVRASGLILSILTVLLIVWSFGLAIGAFRLLKAH